MRVFLILSLLLLIFGLPWLHATSREKTMRNFRCAEPGVLYRSGQMNEAGFERALREYKIATVISLRDARDAGQPAPDEFEAPLCDARNVRYHRLPPLRWSTPNGEVPARENVEKFLKIIRDPKTPKPILIHCFAGIHRTGAFVALYRIDRQGWSNNDAITEMLEVGGSRATFEEDQLDFLRKYQPDF